VLGLFRSQATNGACEECPVLFYATTPLDRDSHFAVWHTGKHKDGAVMPSYNAQALVNIERINKGHAVSSDWSGEGILGGAILQHGIWKRPSHEQLDRENPGVLGQAALGWHMSHEQMFPVANVVDRVVGFDAATGDPDRIAVGCDWVGQHVA
jgi:hypothetical protein